MTDKILVICAPDTFVLANVLKFLRDPRFSFEIPDLTPPEDNPELFFMKLCMSLKQYEKIIVLLSDQIFSIKYLDRVLNAMTDLDMGIFISIGTVTTYPDWFPKESVVPFAQPISKSEVELWRQLFSGIKPV